MKFNFSKQEGLDKKIRAFYTLERDGLPFKIIAESSGLVVSGEIFMENMQDLQDLAAKISEAWQMHMNLRPKIINPMDGGAEW